MSTYTYDHANRLTAVSRLPSDVGFAYNGLGDRLQQTMDGVPTNYTLDLNTGLTQVLADGNNTYLYGRARVAEEQPAGWQYDLGDALGSVRHLTDASAAVASARAYEPFGATLSSTSAASSSYTFTGEWLDPTGLIHLRARYLDPTQGRFLQKDTWSGLPHVPYSQNHYPYAASNPVNLRDPSGRCWDWSPGEGLVERVPLRPEDGPCPGSIIEGPGGQFDFSTVIGGDPLRHLVQSGSLQACTAERLSRAWIGPSPGPLWEAVDYVREATVQLYFSTSRNTMQVGPTGVPSHIPIFVTARTIEAVSWDSVRGSYPEMIGSLVFTLGLSDSGVSVVLRMSDARGFAPNLSLGVVDCTVSLGALSLQVACLGSRAQVKLRNLVQRQFVIATSRQIAAAGGYRKFAAQSVFLGVPLSSIRYFVRQTSFDKEYLIRRWPGAIVFGP